MISPTPSPTLSLTDSGASWDLRTGRVLEVLKVGPHHAQPMLTPRSLTPALKYTALSPIRSPVSVVPENSGSGVWGDGYHLWVTVEKSYYHLLQAGA